MSGSSSFQGGIYVFQVFDYYAASGMVLLLFCFTECVAISWVYGACKWLMNVSDMVGPKPLVFTWLKFCWLIVTPTITMGLLITAVVNYEPLKFRNGFRITFDLNAII